MTEDEYHMGLDLCHNSACERSYFERAKVHFACARSEFVRKCSSRKEESILSALKSILHLK